MINDDTETLEEDEGEAETKAVSIASRMRALIVLLRRTSRDSRIEPCGMKKPYEFIRISIRISSWCKTSNRFPINLGLPSLLQSLMQINHTDRNRIILPIQHASPINRQHAILLPTQDSKRAGIARFLGRCKNPPFALAQSLVDEYGRRRARADDDRPVLAAVRRPGDVRRGCRRIARFWDETVVRCRVEGFRIG